MTTLFGKELFILFAASAFRKLSSIYVFSYFPFGFEGRIWDLIVSVPDHCLSFYFKFERSRRSAWSVDSEDDQTYSFMRSLWRIDLCGGLCHLNLQLLIGHTPDEDVHIPEFKQILRRELAILVAGRLKTSPTARPSPWSVIPTLMSLRCICMIWVFN